MSRSIPHTATKLWAGLKAVARSSTYLGASLLLHGIVAGGLLLATDPLAGRPKLGLMWLDLENQLPAAPASAAPPGREAAEAPPAPSTAKPERRKPPRKPRPKPNKAPAPSPLESLDLAESSPNHASLTLAVRCDRIRRSPYADGVRRVLEVFYDHRMLLWSSDIDPVRDFDALVIATPNPYRITQTFLAVRHHLASDTLRAALDNAVRSAAGEMRWTREGSDWIGRIPSPPRMAHDPRILVERPGLLLLLEPRLRARLRRSTQRDRSSRSHDLIASLMAIDDESPDEGPAKEPALVVDAVNLSRLVVLPPGVPMPARLRLTVPATSPTRVTARAWMASTRDAARFRAELQSRLAAGRRSILALMLGMQPLLGRIRVDAKGTQVRARLRLSARELSQVLMMFRDAIPQTPIPGRAPPPRRLPSRRPNGSKGAS